MSGGVAIIVSCMAAVRRTIYPRTRILTRRDGARQIFTGHADLTRTKRVRGGGGEGVRCRRLRESLLPKSFRARMNSTQ